MPVRPDIGMRDAYHLESRVGSLTLEPELHPGTESRLALALRGAWASRDLEQPWHRRAILASWFLCVGLLPALPARRAVEWRLDRSSRPKALALLIRCARQALR
jgi:hypothetical protein